MEDATTSGHSISVNGMELFFRLTGEGEPLMLLHGFSGCGDDWQYIFKTPPAGYRMIAPDLRGHGRSTNPSRQFTFRQSALDMLALLDTLQIDCCKAIGLSGGAKTLLHLATEQPLRLEAMVLVSATPYFPEQARAAMRQLTPENQSAEEWHRMRQTHHYGEEQILDLWRQANGFKDSFDDMNFTPPLLSTITARTLIVHGDRDPLYPVSLAVEMYNAIPGSYLWVIPNGGHGCIFGDHAEGFVKTATAFLRGDWSSSSSIG